MYSNIKAGEVKLREVGKRALNGSKYRFAEHNIGVLEVEKAGDEFGMYSNIKAGEVKLREVGKRALNGGNDVKMRFTEHEIGVLEVEKAGDYLGTCSTLYTNKEKLKLGENVKFGGEIKDIEERKMLNLWEKLKIWVRKGK